MAPQEHCSVIVVLREQERPNNPLRPLVRHLTAGSPQTATASLPSTPPLPDPEATPLGIAGTVDVMYNSSQAQDGGKPGSYQLQIEFPGPISSTS